MSGRTTWSVGDKVRVYRTKSDYGRIDEEDLDPRDYDIDHYLRVLRQTYAARLARAFRPEDFEAVFEDPEQPSLFAAPMDSIAPILTVAHSGYPTLALGVAKGDG